MYNFPYTNFHELNLDWIIEEVKRLAARVDHGALSGGGAAVSVTDFGAVGNGVADDTEAFQRAIDSGKDVYIPLASGEKYLITRTLNINTIGQRFFSETPSYAYGDLSKIIYSGTGVLFSATTGQAGFYNLRMESVNPDGRTAIKSDATRIYDNNDGVIYGCYISNFDTAIDTYGRGAHIINNYIHGANNGLILNYTFPGGGTSNHWQQPTTGYRSIRICGNRWHGMRTHAILISGDHAYGIAINNNMLDGGYNNFFVGITGIVDGIDVIDNQIIGNCSLVSHTGSECNNMVIRGNSIRLPEEISDLYRPAATHKRNIYIAGKFNALTVENNTFVNAGAPVYAISGSEDNHNGAIMVSGNTFINPAADNGHIFAVLCNVRSTDRVNITNNIVLSDDAAATRTIIRQWGGDSATLVNSFITGNIVSDGFAVSRSNGVTAGAGSVIQEL